MILKNTCIKKNSMTFETYLIPHLRSKKKECIYTALQNLLCGGNELQTSWILICVIIGHT